MSRSDHKEPSKDKYADINSPPEKCRRYTLPSAEDEDGASGSVSTFQHPSSVECPDTKISSTYATGESSNVSKTVSTDSTTVGESSTAEKKECDTSASGSCTESCSGEEILKETQKLCMEFCFLVRAFENNRHMEELKEQFDAEQASRDDDSAKPLERDDSSSTRECSTPGEKILPAKGTEKQASPISKPIERVLRSRKISISLSPSKSSRAHASKASSEETTKSDVASSKVEKRSISLPQLPASVECSEKISSSYTPGKSAADASTTAEENTPSGTCTQSSSLEEILKETQKLCKEFGALAQVFENFRRMAELKKRFDAKEASHNAESAKPMERGESSGTRECSTPGENIPPAKDCT